MDTLRNQLLKKARRIVVKIGSGVITRHSARKRGKQKTQELDLKVLREIVRQSAELAKTGCEIIIVTSGAVAAGMAHLKFGDGKSPLSIPQKQAAAALGQGALIAEYAKALKRAGKLAAQILLTHDDLSNRRRFVNARSTIYTLLEKGVVPVINENDTVAVHELRFGDNDSLSAMVANLVEADLLVILSDVAGLYTADPATDPRAELISVVEKITPEIELLAGDSASAVGTGGMKTKLLAAKTAVAMGIPMIIAEGKKKGSLLAVCRGENTGTVFLPKGDKLSSRKHWIAHMLRSKGKLTLDDGAIRALLERGKSLLASGIVAVEGKFEHGEAVSCVDRSGHEIAKGIVNYDSADLDRIKGRPSSEIEKILGFKYYDEVIHRDDLVAVTGRKQ